VANQKISQFSVISSLAGADYFPVVQDSDTSNKRVSLTQLLSSIPAGSAASPSIAFIGDNTGIYSPGADQVAISTNGTGRVFVDSSGNVGVGTANPGSLLHLHTAAGTNCTLLLDEDSTNNPLKIEQTATEARIQTTATQPLILAGQSGAGSSSNIRFETRSTERLRITSDGKLGIGTTSPNDILHVVESSASAATPVTASVANFERNGAAGITISSTATTTGSVFFADSGSSAVGRLQYDHNDNSLGFWANSLERARIDSSGRLLVGTSSSANTGDSQYARLQIKGNTFVSGSFGILNLQRDEAAPSITANEPIGRIIFSDNTGAQFAWIDAVADAAAGSGDYPARIVFSTTADGASSPTERMRITNSGAVFIGTTSFISPPTTTTEGLTYDVNGKALILSKSAGSALLLQRTSSDGNIAAFYRETSFVGSISVTTTATAYNTSSDYRLKENVVPLTGAADRLNQLQVHRFNFIADPDKTVDGFVAHEAQAVVPECVTGTKDEVDDEGNPVYQGIDQSKLVPLLTAALQEALAEIESLKARVTALEP